MNDVPARRFLLRQSVFVVPGLLAVAEHGGHFASAGVDVQTRQVGSSAQQWAELRAGACDVAVTATDNLFVWNAVRPGSVPPARIALIAQIETTTLISLVLRPGLTSLDRLEGVHLGVDAPDNGFAVVLRAMMAHLGHADYSLDSVGGVRERLDALVRGRIDATLLSPPLDEAAVNAGAMIGLALRDVYDGYPGLGVVAASGAEPSALDAYLQGLSAALTWARAAVPDELARVLRAAGQPPSVAAAMAATLPMSLEPDVAGLALLAAIRARQGMVVEGAPRADELVGPSGAHA